MLAEDGVPFAIDDVWEDPILCVRRLDWAEDPKDHRGPCHPTMRADRERAGFVVVAWTADGYYELHPRAGNRDGDLVHTYDVRPFLPTSMHREANVEVRIVLPPKPGAVAGDVSSVDDTYGRVTKRSDVPFFARLASTAEFFTEIDIGSRSAWYARDVTSMLSADFKLGASQHSKLGDRVKPLSGGRTLRFGFAYEYGGGISILVPLYIVDADRVRPFVAHSMINRLVPTGRICGASTIGLHATSGTALAISAQHCVSDLAKALGDVLESEDRGTLRRYDLTAFRSEFMTPSRLKLPARSHLTLQSVRKLSAPLTLAPFAIDHVLPGVADEWASTNPFGITALVAAVPYDTTFDLEHDLCLFEYVIPSSLVPRLKPAAITEDALPWGDPSAMHDLPTFVCGAGTNRYGQGSPTSRYVHKVRAWCGGVNHGFLRDGGETVARVGRRQFLHTYGDKVADYDPRNPNNRFANLFLVSTDAIRPDTRVAYFSDTCQGDSGGPLFAQIGGEFVVLGVTSHGYNCGTMAGAMTNVARYASEIHERYLDFGIQRATFDSVRPTSSDHSPPAFALEVTLLDETCTRFEGTIAMEAALALDAEGTLAAPASDMLSVFVHGAEISFVEGNIGSRTLTVTRDAAHKNAFILRKEPGHPWPFGAEVSFAFSTTAPPRQIEVRHPTRSWSAPCRVLDPSVELVVRRDGFALRRSSKGSAFSCTSAHVLAWVVGEQGSKLSLADAIRSEGIEPSDTVQWGGVAARWQSNDGEGVILTPDAAHVMNCLVGTKVAPSRMDYRARGGCWGGWDEGTGLVRWTSRVVLEAAPTWTLELSGPKLHGQMNWDLDAAFLPWHPAMITQIAEALHGSANLQCPHILGSKPFVLQCGPFVFLYTGDGLRDLPSVELTFEAPDPDPISAHPTSILVSEDAALKRAVWTMDTMAPLETSPGGTTIPGTSWGRLPAFSWLTLGRVRLGAKATRATSDGLGLMLEHGAWNPRQSLVLPSSAVSAPATTFVPHATSTDASWKTVEPVHLVGTLCCAFADEPRGPVSCLLGSEWAISIRAEGDGSSSLTLTAQPVVIDPPRSEDEFLLYVVIAGREVFARGAADEIGSSVRIGLDDVGTITVAPTPNDGWTHVTTLGSLPSFLRDCSKPKTTLVHFVHLWESDARFVKAGSQHVVFDTQPHEGDLFEHAPSHARDTWSGPWDVRGSMAKFVLRKQTTSLVLDAFPIHPHDAIVYNQGMAIDRNDGGFEIGATTITPTSYHRSVPVFEDPAVARYIHTEGGYVLVVGDSIPRHLGTIPEGLVRFAEHGPGPVLFIPEHAFDPLRHTLLLSRDGSVVTGITRTPVLASTIPHLIRRDATHLDGEPIALTIRPDGTMSFVSEEGDRLVGIEEGMTVVCKDGRRIANVGAYSAVLTPIRIDDRHFAFVAPKIAKELSLRDGGELEASSVLLSDHPPSEFPNPMLRTKDGRTMTCVWAEVSTPRLPRSVPADVQWNAERREIRSDWRRIVQVALLGSEPVDGRGQRSVVLSESSPTSRIRALLEDGEWVQVWPTVFVAGRVRAFAPSLHGVRLELNPLPRDVRVPALHPSMVGIGGQHQSRVSVERGETEEDVVWVLRTGTSSASCDVYDPSVSLRVTAPLPVLRRFDPEHMVDVVLEPDAGTVAMPVDRETLVHVSNGRGASFLHATRADPSVRSLRCAMLRDGDVIVQGLIARIREDLVGGHVFGFRDESMSIASTVVYEVQPSPSSLSTQVRVLVRQG